MTCSPVRHNDRNETVVHSVSDDQKAVESLALGRRNSKPIWISLGTRSWFGEKATAFSTLDSFIAFYLICALGKP